MAIGSRLFVDNVCFFVVVSFRFAFFQSVTAVLESPFTFVIIWLLLQAVNYKEYCYCNITSIFNFHVLYISFFASTLSQLVLFFRYSLFIPSECSSPFHLLLCYYYCDITSSFLFAYWKRRIFCVWSIYYFNVNNFSRNVLCPHWLHFKLLSFILAFMFNFSFAVPLLFSFHFVPFFYMSELQFFFCCVPAYTWNRSSWSRSYFIRILVIINSFDCYNSLYLFFFFF